MLSKAKGLGAALMAVLAIGAIAASAAQATPTFTGFSTVSKGTVRGHTTIEGTTEEGSVEKFTAGPIGTVECHGKFTGTSLTGEDAELTLTPTYTYPDTSGKTDCTTDIGGTKFTTHINTNGCDYLLHPGEKLEEDVYSGTTDVKCPAGKSIEIKITKLAAEETKCTVTIGAQNGLGPVKYTNKTATKPTDVTVDSEINNITYSSTGGLLNCGTTNGSHTGGTYASNATITGRSVLGNQVSVEVSAGLFTSYGGVTSTKEHTILEGTTEEGAIEKFTAGPIGTFECHGSFTGTSLTGDDTELTITPVYTYPDTSGKTDCTTDIGGTKFTTHINMNGCDYVFHSGTATADPDVHSGTTDIKCPSGPITITITKLAAEETKCTVTVGSQNGLGPIKYTNKTATKPTDVTVDSEINNITYSSAGGLLNCGTTNGSHTGGTYTTNTTLKGFNTVGEQIDIEVSGE